MSGFPGRAQEPRNPSRTSYRRITASDEVGSWLSQRRTRKPGEPDFYSWRGETSHSVDSPGASLPLLLGRELHSPLSLPFPLPIVANSFLTYTSIPFPLHHRRSSIPPQHTIASFSLSPLRTVGDHFLVLSLFSFFTSLLNLPIRLVHHLHLVSHYRPGRSSVVIHQRPLSIRP